MKVQSQQHAIDIYRNCIEIDMMRHAVYVIRGFIFNQSPILNFQPGMDSGIWAILNRIDN